MDAFHNLANVIKAQAQSKTVIYIPNPGNYGDGLIRYATKAFFSDYNIEHIEINSSFRFGKSSFLPLLFNQKAHLFVYGGGGAWSKTYNAGKRTVDFLSQFTSNIIVLPSTYETTPNRSRGTYFRRDEFESKRNFPQSLFCHDMAFYLAHRNIPINADRNGPVGNMFRTDGESKRSLCDIPDDNIDLSTFGNHMSNGDMLLSSIARYSVIHTDRLHLAISGGLVGCDVQLYAGNYFKIKAIFDSSIRDIFPSKVHYAEKT